MDYISKEQKRTGKGDGRTGEGRKKWMEAIEEFEEGWAVSEKLQGKILNQKSANSGGGR